MKNNLLREIKQMLEIKANTGNAIPIPTYLFVQRYGRDIHEYMEEIATLFEQKEWFPFCCANVKKEEKLITGLKMELERHSGIGKEYIGSVLIEFSGMEEEKEIEELLDYIDRQKPRLHCIYTVKASGEVQEIIEQLENYGFARVVEGEEYEVLEQMNIFRDTLKMYQFELDEAAEKHIVKFLERQKWQEEDAVKIRIQNMAKEIVYNQMMEGRQKDRLLRKEEVESVLQSLKLSKTQKRQIGFVMGGAEI